MRMTIYRGTKEIGGTLIEVKTDSTRILIDAGYPLFFGGRPIEDKIARLPYKELLDLGVLPPITGLYAWDKAAFDAVLVSHAHIDHYGLLKYVNSRIPIWMSAGTKTMIEISQRFKIYDDFQMAIQTFVMYSAFKIGDIQVTPYLMDHSAFDAAAFQLTAEGKTVIYTGDFRGHGRKSVCLPAFIKQVTKQADALMIEGSTLGRQNETIITEDALEQILVDQCAYFQGPILFQCSSQNIDRLVSFYRAAKKLKRSFIVDVYTANVLNDLKLLGNHIPYPSDQYCDIKVFYPYQLTQKIFNRIGGEYAQRFSAQHISREDISKDQNHLVMLVRPSMIRDLVRCGLHDGLFFYSLWNGYRDAEYQQKFEESLRQSGFALRALHTSGHATVEDIRMMIKELDPRQVIPIHTMFPETFKEYSDRTVLMEDKVEFEV
jgi:ribonuclease J